MNNPKLYRKKIRIGLDFDGVVAYNPFRIIRAPVAFIKRHIFGVTKLKFYVPHSKLARIFWIIVHESSMFPAFGSDRLRMLSEKHHVEFYLITARFHFLQPSLYRWLRRYRLLTVFRQIHINKDDKQPHEHKLEVINRLKLDYFVEDNWDIVHYLQGKTKAKIFWVYNISDRRKFYRYKVPYLAKFFDQISL
jgi:uncharacterized HAD superfamily protein